MEKKLLVLGIFRTSEDAIRAIGALREEFFSEEGTGFLIWDGLGVGDVKASLSQFDSYSLAILGVGSFVVGGQMRIAFLNANTITAGLAQIDGMSEDHAVSQAKLIEDGNSFIAVPVRIMQWASDVMRIIRKNGGQSKLSAIGAP